jgi:hypothetical protein
MAKCYPAPTKSAPISPHKTSILEAERVISSSRSVLFLYESPREILTDYFPVPIAASPLHPSPAAVPGMCFRDSQDDYYS